MDWTTNGEGYTASGRWVWELTPYLSKIAPKTDQWIIKGRHAQERMWKWFGAYTTLAGAQDWAMRLDAEAIIEPSHHRLNRAYGWPEWNDDSED